ncbi:diguanylate cyclase [Pseudomonas putida]|nr:diguanylate cyclase [Pseudomonas putida]
MGAGLPANTGEAGAIHRGACIAGKPAPIGVGTRFRSLFSAPHSGP